MPVAAAAIALAAFALAASAAPDRPRLADKSPNAIAVDVELVLAVDVSYSMDPEEQALQREGYIQALTSHEFLQALREGANGKIAITYFEWAGQFDQKIIMPWRLIEGPESADAVAAEIAARAIPARLAHLDFRRAAFRQAAVRQQRLSRPAPRDRRVRRRRQQFRRRWSCRRATRCSPPASPSTACRSCSSAPIAGTMDIDNLDVYYEDCVIGGPGAFVVPIRERAKFIEATRTKLVLEIAGRQPRAARRSGLRRRRRASPAPSARSMWQDRWGGGFDFQ